MRDPVAVLPPIEVVRPAVVAAIPAADGMPGGTQYSIKIDGFRCCAFALGDHAVLQSRSGRDMAAQFPQIADAVTGLPAGTVIDGEVCAVVGGVFAFEQLLRAPANREPGTQIAFVAFDQIAAPGLDLSARLLRERWRRLEATVADAPALIQLVLATEDRQEALSWYDALVPAGVEGLVAKGWSTAYRQSAGWGKIRHADTADAAVLAVLGPASRPQALRVRLPDGRTRTTMTLDPVYARRVALALDDAGGDVARLAAEVKVGTGRHGTVRLARIRPAGT